VEKEWTGTVAAPVGISEMSSLQMLQALGIPPEEREAWEVLPPWLVWLLRQVGYTTLEIVSEAGIGTNGFDISELINDINDLDDRPWEGPSEDWKEWNGPVFRTKPFRLFNAHKVLLTRFAAAVKIQMSPKNRRLAKQKADGVIQEPTEEVPGRARPQRPIVTDEIPFRESAVRLVEKKVIKLISERSSEKLYRLDQEYFIEWEPAGRGIEGNRLLFKCTPCIKAFTIFVTHNRTGAHPNCQTVYMHLEKCLGIVNSGEETDERQESSPKRVRTSLGAEEEAEGKPWN